MNKKKKYLVLTGIVIILAAAALVYYRINENIKSSKRPAPPPQSVKVKQPERGDIASKIVISGDILPIQQTNIYSKVTGNIQKIYADIGDYVHQGKLLASIDKSVFLQTVRQTEGLLNQAKATLENNKVNLARTQILFDKGLAPQGDLDNASTLVKVSEAQVATAQANYNNATLQVSYCNVTAPFSGYITKRFLDQGALVSQGTSNSIFILSDISKLKILVNVLEKDIPQLDNVKEVNITIDAYPGEVFRAVFRKMSQAVDLNTRTMPVQVDIENKDGLLKPGMFAKVELLLDIHYGSLSVPEQSVLKDDKGKFVYAINPDTTAVKKYVETGVNSDNKMEIVSGVNETDIVVFVGQELIQENSKVKISK
jgi:membrane fusion protein (multidrug efflux system)